MRTIKWGEYDAAMMAGTRRFVQPTKQEQSPVSSISSRRGDIIASHLFTVLTRVADFVNTLGCSAIVSRDYDGSKEFR